LVIISQEVIKEYRRRTFRRSEEYHLQNSQQAVEFVNQRGFILFWPDPKMELPNLWQAVAGDRPVPDEHDDPGHITWDWKDSLLDKKVWYYARIIRQRNTMISMNLLPFFYALSPNYGSPIDDIQEQYSQGELPLEAKHIFETLLDKGPLDTITLRKEAHLSSANATQPFQRSLNLLQRDFKILPVAIADVGTWHYAFRYELTHRYFPELSESAHKISEVDARTVLIKSYLDSVGAATSKQISMVFSWPLEIINTHLSKHADYNWLACSLDNKDEPIQAYCSTSLK
jgi:hypothetical protein